MKNNHDLPDIREVQPLSSEDQSCLNEIREVLRRNGRLQRFGVSLLHRHFDIADDEILVETCDEEKRTLALQVVKRAALAGSRSIQTNWRLDTNVSLQDCMQCCSYDSDNRHSGSSHL